MFGNLKMFQFYQPLYPKIVSSAFLLLKQNPEMLISKYIFNQIFDLLTHEWHLKLGTPFLSLEFSMKKFTIPHSGFQEPCIMDPSLIIRSISVY